MNIPKDGAEGVVTCAGSFSAGWTPYIKDKKPRFRYQAFEIADVEISGDVELPEGEVIVKTEFAPDPTSKTGGGMLKLFVNDRPAGEGKLTRTFFRHGLEPFEVGRDSITAVDPAYKDQGEFSFTGKIDKVTFELIQK